MLKLTIGYSVLAERAKNITQPQNSNWELMVITQGETSYGIPNAKQISLNSLGVAKSRNCAIDNASGEYLVFADDDIVFSEDGLQKAIDYLDAHPQVSLLLTQATDPSGNLRKQYPPGEEKLSLYNSARAATYEMIVRVAEIRRLGIRFDEEFGAGVENYLGDEYIFIADLLRAGGSAKFVPITTAIHPEQSSGAGWGTARDRIARVRVFTRVFGMAAPLVRLAFGARRIRELGGIGKLFLFILGR